MAAKGPNKPSTPQPSEVVKEALGIAKKTPGAPKTPAQAQNLLSQKESDTLDALRKRDKGFWSAMGRMTKIVIPFAEGESPTAFGAYKAKIREVADTEAQGLMTRMGGLVTRGKDMLSKVGIKTAEHLARITARVNVAQRTVYAIDKHRKQLKAEMEDLHKMIKAIREHAETQSPLLSRVPLYGMWRTDIKIENALGSKEDDILLKAAEEVRREAQSEKTEYKRAEEENFKNIRDTETTLRSEILRYNPDAVDSIEEMLHKCAEGDTKPIMDAITALKTTHDPAKEAQLKKLLTEAVSVLSGQREDWLRSRFRGSTAAQSKAFEVAGRLDISGTTPAELLKQVTSMVIGTRVDVQLGSATAHPMVIFSKLPADHLVLKRIGSDEKVFFDLTKNEGWRLIRPRGGQPPRPELINMKTLSLSLAA